GERADDLVVVVLIGRWGTTGHLLGAHEAPEPGGVPGAADAEHAVAHADDARLTAVGPRAVVGVGGDGVAGGVRAVGCVGSLVAIGGRVGHRNIPSTGMSGRWSSAACSAARIASARFAPSGM